MFIQQAIFSLTCLNGFPSAQRSGFARFCCKDEEKHKKDFSHYQRNNFY